MSFNNDIATAITSVFKKYNFENNGNYGYDDLMEAISLMKDHGFFESYDDEEFVETDIDEARNGLMILLDKSSIEDLEFIKAYNGIYTFGDVVTGETYNYNLADDCLI